MSGTSKKFTEAEKLAALARMEAGANVTRLAEEMGVRRRLLYAWRDILRERGGLREKRRGRPRKGRRPAGGIGASGDASSGGMSAPALHQRIAELERKIGQQELELDFLQEALRRVGGTPPSSAAAVGTGSTVSSRK